MREKLQICFFKSILTNHEITYDTVMKRHLHESALLFFEGAGGKCLRHVPALRHCWLLVSFVAYDTTFFCRFWTSFAAMKYWFTRMSPWISSWADPWLQCPANYQQQELQPYRSSPKDAFREGRWGLLKTFGQKPILLNPDFSAYKRFS